MLKENRAMKSEFYVSKIFVIESLTEDDRHTGTSLYEDIIERSLIRKPKLGCKLMRPGGYTEFVNCLDEVLQEAKLSDGFPYIHFEIHYKYCKIEQQRKRPRGRPRREKPIDPVVK